MKHRQSLRKLNKSSAHRWSMLRTMVTQLLEYQRIETTLPKAKELRRLADRVITWGKEGGIQAKRRAATVVRTDRALFKLFNEYAQRYRERDGGYTRIMQSRRRDNDRAQLAYIEYIDRKDELRPAKPPARRGMFLPAAAQVLSEQPQQRRKP